MCVEKPVRTGLTRLIFSRRRVNSQKQKADQVSQRVIQAFDEDKARPDAKVQWQC